MANGTVNDPKEEALRATRTLNPRPEAVVDAVFTASEFCDPRDLVQVKYEMVRRVRVDKVPAARAVREFGFSRQVYYDAVAALDAGGPAALVPGKPGPKGPRKLTDPVMEYVETRLAADPALRSRDLADAVFTEYGVSVHPRSIERALARRETSRAQESPKSRS
ncbi:helix-turn-helix domain-containing protein [Streptomyces sp. F001]|uniref:helix-turn-helix domain-containing protein n=1 Tax=Streptomyces sp. F001 TaxID=1510026 RepID=UPI00101E3533|nr:helix-turn-helix domain containing protein [Streptomyces sp. F001]RZB19549.1 helix-turn-helix domain-containing protein [Streptomyces sp. F001]